MWRYKGANVVNDKGKMLHVQGNIDSENRNIEVQNRNNGLN